MVRPANRSAVEATPPEPTSPDAESYIAISGECGQKRLLTFLR